MSRELNKLRKQSQEKLKEAEEIIQNRTVTAEHLTRIKSEYSRVAENHTVLLLLLRISISSLKRKQNCLILI